MSTAENWYAAKNFQGLDTDGNPCDFVRGDLIPKVHTWPTFSSLRNISWIVNNPIEGVPSTKRSGATTIKKNEVENKKKVAKKNTKAAIPVVASSIEDLLPCDQCDKAFKTSRALKMHQRYHK